MVDFLIRYLFESTVPADVSLDVRLFITISGECDFISS